MGVWAFGSYRRIVTVHTPPVATAYGDVNSYDELDHTFLLEIDLDRCDRSRRYS